MEKSYKYLPYFLLLAVPLSIAAFYKTYIIQFPNFEKKNNGFIHIHAIISCMWIAMLITQAFLIKKNNIQLHRRLGKLSYCLFPLLILSFVPQIIRVINSEFAKFVFFPLADCTLLISYYVLAIINKRNTPGHMRYIIGTALVFFGPTFGRIGPIYFGLSEKLTQNSMYTLIYIILFSLILMDRKNNAGYRPYLIIFTGFLFHQLTFNLLF